MPPAPAETAPRDDVSTTRARQLLRDVVAVAENLLGAPDLRVIARVAAAAVDAALKRNTESRG